MPYVHPLNGMSFELEPTGVELREDGSVSYQYKTPDWVSRVLAEGELRYEWEWDDFLDVAIPLTNYAGAVAVWAGFLWLAINVPR